MRKLLVLLALLAAWWARCGAQESIRVDVKLVTVAFSVRDVSGGLVDNLTKDDFEVIEDAAPQKIAFFAKSVDVPLTLGLIVDASGSQEHFAKQHENDLKVFLKEALGPRDRAFLVGFGNHVRLVSDLSTSGEEMMESWRLYDKDSRHFPELGPKEDRDLGTAFYDSIYYPVTEKLASENGRRALLLFSDGEDNSSARHDDRHRSGAGRQCGDLRDSLHGKKAREIDRAQSVRNSCDGPNRERNRGDAHRRGADGSAHLFPADRGGIADVLRAGVLPDKCG